MAGIVQDPTTGGQENRRVNAFLRGPIVAGQTAARYNLAVEAEVRNGVLHQAVLNTLPSPRDSLANDFGVQTSGGFDATIMATDLLPGTYSADGHWDGYSLVSLYGENPTSFTRNLPVPVPDWEGAYRWTLPDEFAPAAGCRRIENLINRIAGANTITLAGVTLSGATLSSTPDADGFYTLTRTSAALNWANLTFESLNIGYSMADRQFTPSVEVKRVLVDTLFTVLASDVTTTTKSSPLYTAVADANLYAATLSGFANTGFIGAIGIGLSNNGDAIKIRFPQCEDVTGASVKGPSQRVSVGAVSAWPFHGFGKDGIVWSRAFNANTVNATTGVVTVATPTQQRQAWFYLPGRTGNTLSTPSAAANQISGDLVIIAQIVVPAVAAVSTILEGSYAGASTNTNFLFQYAAGPLRYYWAVGSSLFSVDSADLSASVLPGSLVFVRLRHTVNSAGNRIIEFAWSYDETNWTVLTTSTSATGVGNRNVGANTWYIGAWQGANDPYAGRILQVKVFNGFAATTPAVWADAGRFAVGASTAVMSTGETWTVNTSGAGNVARIAEAFTDATQRPSYHTPQEANLITADINAWTETGTTVTTAATGPDGLLTAWTLTDNDGAAHEFRSHAITVSNDSATRSVLVYVLKDAITARFACVGLVYSGGTGTGRRVHIDTSTGALTVDSVQNAGSNETALDAGLWWGIRLAVANNSTGNTTMTVECYPAYSNVAGTANVAAQGSTTFAWPMAVLGSRVAAYNPPGAGTRNEATLRFPASVVNDAEGMVYLEAQLDAVPAADVVLIGDSGSTRALAMVPQGANKKLGTRDGTNTVNATSARDTARNRLAVAWSGAVQDLCVNGTIETAAGAYDGAFSPTLLSIGAANTSGSAPSGSIGPIKWGKKRPPTSYLISCNASRDLFSRGDFDTIRDNSKGTTWELEILSQLTRANGASIELTDVRRAVAKRISVTKNKLSLSFVDIDTDALDRVYPSNKYSKEEFTNIYEGHIGRVIPDLSPGTQLKVPGAFINTNGTTTWTISFGERRTGPTYTINTVYRDGRIVSASEYSVSTATATSGLVVVTVVFAREQRDTSGKQYEFTADITVSGTREPSTEIQRLLAKVGVPTDAASFTTAAAVDVAGGFYIDAAYTTEVQLKVIIEYLLQVARGDLVKTSTGAWAIVQDKARSSVATLREQDSLIDVESVEEPMPPRAYELKYRPRFPASNDWQFTATRTGTGTAETMRIQNPYIYDGNVADRLIDYIAKRENTRRDAKLKVWGAMFDNGDVLTVTGVSCYTGNRDWLIRGVERPTDANTLTARQYDSTIYTYGAGTIPAGASSGYAADYSQTAPSAPTGLTYTGGSSGTTISTDGVARAYMFFSCTPPTPANSFARIIFTAQDGGGGYVRVEGKKNGAVYEAVLGNLRPGVSHTVNAYAVSANGQEGSLVSTSQTSPGYSVTPATPGASASGTQVGSRKVRFNFSPSSSTNIAKYQARFSNDAGSSWGPTLDFGSSVVEGEFSDAALAAGFAYADIRAVDTFGTFSAWRGIYGIAISANITNATVASNAVGNTNIVASAVDNGKVTTATLTLSRQNTVDYYFFSSVAAGTNIDLQFLDGAYAPRITADNPADFTLRPASDVGGFGTAHIGVYNNAGVARTLYRYYKVLS
jgi:hypothetical protein